MTGESVCERCGAAHPEGVRARLCGRCSAIVQSGESVSSRQLERVRATHGREGLQWVVVCTRDSSTPAVVGLFNDERTAREHAAIVQLRTPMWALSIAQLRDEPGTPDGP